MTLFLILESVVEVGMSPDPTAETKFDKPGSSQ